MTEQIIRWDSKVSPKDVVGWAVMACGLIAMFVNLQNAVETNKNAIAALTKRADDSDIRDRMQDERFNSLNNNFSEMKGDIKVIRQMLESRKP